MKDKITLFWLRRDLRLDDNAALYHALKEKNNVVPLFIFDKNILDKLHNKKDARVCFIHQTLSQINEKLHQLDSSLLTQYGTPLEIFQQLAQTYEIEAIYTNHDYEPYARQRDRQIYDWARSQGIAMKTYKDQCIFEYKEVLKEDGKPYTVFTPYSKKWKAKLTPFYLKPYPTSLYYNHFSKIKHPPIHSLAQIGFSPSSIPIPSQDIDHLLIEKYGERRNFPAIKGTSRLGIHLRFGTLSIRKLAQIALEKNETFLNELIWRDFYMMILWHFPHVVSKSFKPAYDQIQWRNDPDEFSKWCEGKTGYPIVDAGMRELNQTGFMHNRVRMIVASFLTKHLLIDWRWGEAYFAEKLLDFDLSANNGGWQWAAGSGCDAAPYFRVFNPSLQTEKFDPKHEYIKKWVPEYNDPFTYVKPIVNHEFARKRVLEVYSKALEIEKT